MGAEVSKVKPVKVDEFVRSRLIECNCENVLQVFADNEIDKDAFLLLSEDDLKSLLPEKLGPRKKIFAIIHRLRYDAEVEAERNRIKVSVSETLQALPDNNGSHHDKVNCSTSTLPATTSYELHPPPSHKILPKDFQTRSSSSLNDMIAVVPNERDVIYPDENNINILQQKTLMVPAPLVHFSSEAPSSSYRDIDDITLEQITLMRTPRHVDSSLEANSHFQQDDFDVTSHSTTTQIEEIDVSYPTVPSNFIQNTADTISSIIQQIRSNLDKPELYQTSAPEDRNICIDEMKEDEQKKIYDVKEKVNSQQGRRNHSKVKSESVRGNEVKRPYRKEKYNSYNSHPYKIPVPQKIIESRKKLPIYKYKEQFLNMVKQNSVVIVIAETGSGKSTQMPQYLAKDNYDRKIICTQPRRLAAKSLARRVAIEYGSRLGTEVGYRVRFDNCTENTTKISYVTEGVLIHELVTDVTASSYSVVIIDEAHERNLNTDVLLGCLKKAITSRSDLRVIISSATVEAAKFSTFFNNAPVLDIPGRSHQVEIFYTGKPNPDYLTVVVGQVCRIHCSASLGDILVFLPGQEDIEYAADAITRGIRESPNAFVRELVLPLFSRLPAEQQNLIFDPAPPNTRKIILATNIAETSLTIDGIVHVVDSGLVKQAEYIGKGNTVALECTTLVTIPITKAQAKQRSGRAGRTQPGKAYRIYSQDMYEKMAKSPVPEILRQNLEMVVLLLFSMGVKDILQFDFLDSPPSDALVTALEKLEEFGALNKAMLGYEYILTGLGRQMSGFPVEPYLSKMLIMSSDLGCSEEMLTIISMLSAQIQKLFKRPKEKKFEADSKKKTFDCREGDHVTLLNVYNKWRENRSSRAWCNDFFLDWRTLEEVYEIRCQLSTMLDEQKIIRNSCEDDMTKIQIAIASGSFRKVAWRFNNYNYYTFTNPTDEPVFIHPSSVLFHLKPNLVIYDSIIKTKKAYMSQVLEIDREYIERYAESFYKKLSKVMPC